jgi:hypothetical protein
MPASEAEFEEGEMRLSAITASRGISLVILTKKEEGAREKVAAVSCYLR